MRVLGAARRLEVSTRVSANDGVRCPCSDRSPVQRPPAHPAQERHGACSEFSSSSGTRHGSRMGLHPSGSAEQTAAHWPTSSASPLSGPGSIRRPDPVRKYLTGVFARTSPCTRGRCNPRHLSQRGGGHAWARRLPWRDWLPGPYPPPSTCRSATAGPRRPLASTPLCCRTKSATLCHGSLTCLKTWPLGRVGRWMGLWESRAREPWCVHHPVIDISTAPERVVPVGICGDGGGLFTRQQLLALTWSSVVMRHLTHRLKDFVRASARHVPD